MCHYSLGDDYNIFEEPIGFFVPKTDSETLFRVIKYILYKYALPLATSCGQAYDGAANMFGHVRGVAT